MNSKEYDYCIVGAGLSGATIAHLAAKDNKKVLVIDKRNHIAGNVYDSIDSITGIRISHYGAHLFHTNDKEVWEFIQQFGPWARWDHKVVVDISGVYVPVPVNITTINSLFNKDIETESEMRAWLENERLEIENPKNSEEVALSKVGTKLYSLLFKEYTYKQWAKGASELDPSVLSRIPIRYSQDPRYFSDKYQGLPVNGYTSIVESMLNHPNITVNLNTSWDDIKLLTPFWKELIFTGPIDVYFQDRGLPPLEYRSINFHWERILTKGFYQPNSVVNYPSSDISYTRCVEYKHFLNQKSDWTILSKETTSSNGEPYYPVPTETNQQLYQKYVKFASTESNIHFIGRLASYKYFNMDQAIRNAMDYYKKHFTNAYN